jgi:hypothetical protein
LTVILTTLLTVPVVLSVADTSKVPGGELRMLNVSVNCPLLLTATEAWCSSPPVEVLMTVTSAMPPSVKPEPVTVKVVVLVPDSGLTPIVGTRGVTVTVAVLVALPPGPVAVNV